MKTFSYDRERDFFLGKATSAVLFNPAAFQNVPNYVLGNASRNYSSLRSPAGRNENLNLKKHFAISDRVNASIQFDWFNAFNRTTFGSPATNASFPTLFGTAQSAGQGNANRQGQIQARIEF